MKCECNKMHKKKRWCKVQTYSSIVVIDMKHCLRTSIKTHYLYENMKIISTFFYFSTLREDFIYLSWKCFDVFCFLELVRKDFILSKCLIQNKLGHKIDKYTAIKFSELKENIAILRKLQLNHDFIHLNDQRNLKIMLSKMFDLNEMRSELK